MATISGDAAFATGGGDEEDELFGDLVADDHADVHERVVNPQQAAGANAGTSAMSTRASRSTVRTGDGGGGEYYCWRSGATSSSSAGPGAGAGAYFGGGHGVGGGGGLAGHEARANEVAFHKMGYLEAYDAAKEERLQEGFEVGYREAVDVAQSVGLRLGRLVGRAASAADTKLVSRTIRAFLDGQLTQQSDAVTADEALRQVRDLEKMVKEQCG